jgi:hypothetical protein
MIDSKLGVDRERIGLDEYNELVAKGILVSDDRRRRPLWFDGRFLDAAALNSEQNYILGRQADIARVAGVGVLDGLSVERTENRARSVSVKKGHGITPSGGLVMISQDVEVDLADVPEIQKLDASFGLAELPKQSAINRSGLYILALRPVEFTANPVASYPTSIDGARSVEDGNIIEATAITLIPYPDQSARIELGQRRKRVVHEVFVDGSQLGQPQGVLPLAMVALNQGVIQWLDMFMVRREAGALDHDVFGLGLSPRALREAYLRQYYEHLSEVLSQNNAAGGRFAAAEHFAALPAAGPMPAASINTDDFSQVFFPAEMDVDLTIIAEDELPALIEDSYTLPPIDLTLEPEFQESTSILVVIPVARSKLRQLSLSLKSLARDLPAAAPGMVSKRKPVAALKLLSQRRISSTSTISAEPDETAWKQLLHGVEILWYVRRRNLHYKERISAKAVSILRDESLIEDSVTSRLSELKLTSLVGNIKRRGTTTAEAEIMNLFSSPALLGGSSIALNAAVHEINNLEKVDRASVLKVAERFNTDVFGTGVSRLEKAEPTLSSNKKKLDLLSNSGKLPELDEVANALTPQEFEKFSSELSEASSATDASSEKIARLIEDKYASLSKTSTTLARSNELVSRRIVSSLPRVG